MADSARWDALLERLCASDCAAPVRAKDERALSSLLRDLDVDDVDAVHNHRSDEGATAYDADGAETDAIAFSLLAALQRCHRSGRACADDGRSAAVGLPALLLTALAARPGGRVHAAVLKQPSFLALALALTADDPSLSPLLGALLSASDQRPTSSPSAPSSALLALLRSLDVVEDSARQFALAAADVLVAVLSEREKDGPAGFPAELARLLCALFPHGAADAAWRLRVLRCMERLLNRAQLPSTALDEIVSTVTCPSWLSPCSADAMESAWLLCPVVRLLEAVARSSSVQPPPRGAMQEAVWSESEQLIARLGRAYDGPCEALTLCAVRTTAAIASSSPRACLRFSSSPQPVALLSRMCAHLHSSSDDLQHAAMRGLSDVLDSLSPLPDAAPSVSSQRVVALRSLEAALSVNPSPGDSTLLEGALQSSFETTRLVADVLRAALQRCPSPALAQRFRTDVLGTSQASGDGCPTTAATAADPAAINAAVWPFALSRYLALQRDDADVRAHALPTGDERARLQRSRCTTEAFGTACAVFAERRAYVHLERALTYRELGQRVQRVAAGLRSPLGGALWPGAMVALLGASSIDWVVLHYALLHCGCTTAPLQLSNSDDDLLHCIRLTRVDALLCEEEQWDTRMRALLTAQQFAVIPKIILFPGRAASDSPAPTASDGRPSLGALVSRLHELESLGRSLPVPKRVMPSADSVVLVLYTSGSTGRPKAVAYTERFWHAVYLAALDAQPPWPAVPRVALNYLPLSHNSGLVHLNQTLMNGGVTHFPSQPDLSSLLDDAARVEPTHLILVPRVSALVHQHYAMQLAHARTACSLQGGQCPEVAAMVMRRMRRGFLGGRLLFILIGTAPTDDAIWRFLVDCFDVATHHVYGTTESFPAILRDQRADPREVLDFRLEAVPEMGYSPEDRPNPRGELWLRLRCASSGYFRDPNATAALFSGPFFKTGDVVERTGRTRLLLIDRRSAIVKLAQGEFVAVSRLEQLFVAGSALVHQMYIHADSAQSFLVAVIVPEADALEDELNDGPMETSQSVRQALQRELLRVGAERSLKPWEVPRAFLVEAEPFSAANGLLTESNKPARQHLKQHYGARLSLLYAQHGAQSAPLGNDGGLPPSLSPDASDEAAVRRAVVEAFASALHVHRARASPEGLLKAGAEHSFLQLGGDSVSAMALSERLRLQLSATVSVTDLLGPDSVAELIARVVAAVQSGTAHVGAAPRSSVWMEDVPLLVDRHLEPTYNFVAADMAERSLHVFLTGATGFLGVFILARLLEHPFVSRVTALVRADSAREGLSRIVRTAERYQCARSDFATRVAVACGDLSLSPRFGLAEAEWAVLCGDVDVVVHNGAAVHWLQPYASLRQVNVLSTIDALALASTARVKRLLFVSSVSAIDLDAYLHHSADDADCDGVSEDDPLDACAGRLSQGYGQSKWVCERVLAEARRRGMPVSVVRPCYVLGHCATGATNPSDFLWRLVQGCVELGVAPRLPALINACAVDHVADVVVEAGLHAHLPASAEAERTGINVFHLQQPQRLRFDDLFTIVARTGYAVSLTGYAEWAQAVRRDSEGSDRRSAALFPLLHFVLRNLPAATRSLNFDDRHTRDLLARSDCSARHRSPPPLDEFAIRASLRFLTAIGTLSKPPAPSAHSDCAP